jgi:hypothetical protein
VEIRRPAPVSHPWSTEKYKVASRFSGEISRGTLEDIVEREI